MTGSPPKAADAATVQAIMDLAYQIRRHALQMVARADSSHIGGALSMTDLLAVLYGDILQVKPEQPAWPDRDRFVLSKGHCCSALYAALALKGFFPVRELETYGLSGSRLMCHASHEVPGVEWSTGSLGHGLGLASGQALIGKRLHKNWRVVALLSDGELNEGSNWEAILFAGHHQLDHLTVVVDVNRIQSLGRTRDIIDLGSVADKFLACGWAAVEVDGHDVPALLQTFRSLPVHQPRAVIAHTVKGKGVSYMEDKLEWHYRAPKTPELLNLALQQLATQYGRADGLNTGMRNTFIDHLTRKAAHDPSLFLVGDLGFTVVEPFMEKFPDRFLNAGVAEQNMTSLAAGIAREGYRVFTYSIANFTTLRCLEQIRNDVCYHRLPVCVVSVGGGFMYGNLGPTHHATEDIAVMRALPYTRVFVPFSKTSTRMALDEIVAGPGPAYLRLGREDQPCDLVADNGFTLVHRARPDGWAPSCLISVGQLAQSTLAEARAEGADVYALCRIKPLPEGTVELLARYQQVRVIEDHQFHGGAFSALSEVTSRLQSSSIRDRLSSRVAKEVEQRQAMITGPEPDKGM